MPAVNKVGTQLLVSPHIRARAQALAIVRQESVAEIYRVALEGAGLPGMERAHASSLALLNEALDKIEGQIDRRELLNVLIDSKIRYADLFDATGRALVKLPKRVA